LCYKVWQEVRHAKGARPAGRPAGENQGRSAGKPEGPGRTGADNCPFIEAVTWATKTGPPLTVRKRKRPVWRRLPPEHGKRPRAHKRFVRWAKGGAWQMIFDTLAAGADTEWPTIDSAIVRAHRRPAGGEGGEKTGHRALQGRAWHEGARPLGRPGAPDALRPDWRPSGAVLARPMPQTAEMLALHGFQGGTLHSKRGRKL
jgi:hypothetical protein